MSVITDYCSVMSFETIGSSRGGELSRQVGRNRGLKKDSSAQRRRQDGKHEFHVSCVRGPNLEVPLDTALHMLGPSASVPAGGGGT